MTTRGRTPAATRCTQWRRLPLGLAREARQKSVSGWVDAAVQCQLVTHDDVEHFGLLDDLGAYNTALWLRWRGRTDAELLVLADCPVVAPGPDGEGCCLFVGHTERHTWQDTQEDLHPRPPRNESCADCAGTGTNSSGKTCGTCNGLGGIHCLVGLQAGRMLSPSSIRKEHL